MGPLFFWCPPILYRLPTTNSPGRILGHQLESWYNRILAQQKLSFRMSEGKGFFVESWNPNVSGNNLLHLRDFFLSKPPSVVGFNYFWVFGFKKCNFFYKKQLLQCQNLLLYKPLSTFNGWRNMMIFLWWIYHINHLIFQALGVEMWITFLKETSCFLGEENGMGFSPKPLGTSYIHFSHQKK